MRQGVINRAKKEANSSEDITLEYIKSLAPTEDRCPIFGITLQYGSKEQCDNSATIDAINHSKGHVKGNLKIISKKANTIKNNSTPEEMGLLISALKPWKAPIIEHMDRPNRIKGSKTTQEQLSKVCSFCREEKALNLFHKSSSATRIGISNKCVRCTALSSMIKNAKQRCKDSGRDITIDDYYLDRITTGLVHCPVLGVELMFGGTGSIKDNSASIDRFDTTKGYVQGNVWIISYKANRMKSDATVEELEKVYDYMILDNPATAT